jgi:LysR family transcriptional regulator, cyn operon transcriptional activator
MLDECFRSCGAQPHVVAEINTLAPMMDLVAKTQLASIMAANVVTPQSGLVVVRLESPTPVRTPGMLWSPVARDAAATRAFSTIVRKLALRSSLQGTQ